MDLMSDKSLLQSKTFWGAMMTIASTASIFFKVDLGEPTLWVNAFSGFFGGALAIYGRVKAVKKIQ